MACKTGDQSINCTVPKVIDFPRYNMKSSGENVILRGIVHVVSRFPLHFMLNCGNLDCFSNSVGEGRRGGGWGLYRRLNNIEEETILLGVKDNNS